jgi:hypothetical protein
MAFFLKLEEKSSTLRMEALDLYNRHGATAKIPTLIPSAIRASDLDVLRYFWMLQRVEEDTTVFQFLVLKKEALDA